MTIFTVGINHKTASISLRERIYFPNDKLTLYLQDLLSNGCVEEAILLSTCNRSELYCHTTQIDSVREWFFQQAGPHFNDELSDALYVYHNEAALAHIMRVACGLDSMVLGEPQIFGQMKEAFSESCTVPAVGTLFQRLFQQVFAIAKEIRTTTAIGACPVSVASAAFHFTKSQLKDLTYADVAIIGAGDTSALLMQYLHPHLEKPITLVNRSLDNAIQCVAAFGGQALGLDQLPDVLATADVVFSATGSIQPIVTKEMVANARAHGNSKPILFIDVAVPRDIDPAVMELPNVQLYCIDDLKNIIEKNRLGRQHAADKAEEMIVLKSKTLLAELTSLDTVGHTIRAYRGQMEDICRDELTKAKQKLKQGADPTLVLDTFARAFIKKLLHAPSVQLRQAGAEGRIELLNYAKQLFAIPDV